jgi:hypothetical protein
MNIAFQVRLELTPKDKTLKSSRVEGVVIAKDSSKAKDKAVKDLKKSIKIDGAIKVDVCFLSAKELPSDFVFI